MKQEAIAFILSGGAGKRLYPLTRDRTKPAVPFGGNYRVIDFVLSNFLNSKIEKIYILTQYEPRSLEEHIMKAWVPVFGTGKYSCIRILPPRQGSNTGWYSGTADAVYQNRRFIIENKPKLVNIFCGDHIYLMDVSQMNNYHLKKQADLTISAIPVKVELAANSYGVLVVDEEGKLKRFEEKPGNPTPIPGNSNYCLASMGNYSFNPKVLIREMTELHNKKEKESVSQNNSNFSSLDFGFDLIPNMIEKGKGIYVYNFAENRIPGCKIQNHSYWRDIGDLDQFYRANLELLNSEPPFDLYNEEWEILTKATSLNSPKIEGEAKISNSIVSNGNIIIGSEINRSVLSYNIKIGTNTKITDSVLLGYNDIGKKVLIKNAIIDRGVTVPDGVIIGVDKKKDKMRGFTVSPGDVTVVPRKYEFYQKEEKWAI